MNEPAPANPYAAPDAASAQPSAGEAAPDASRWLRLGAALLDGVMNAAATIPGVLVMTLGVATSHAAGRASGHRGVLWMVVGGGVMGLGLLALLVINLVMLSLHGQTLGKRICAIRIVRADRRRCGLGRIFWLRILVPALLGMIPYVGWLFGIVDALFIFGEQRRCVHDLIADTRVVVA